MQFAVTRERFGLSNVFLMNHHYHSSPIDEALVTQEEKMNQAGEQEEKEPSVQVTLQISKHCRLEESKAMVSSLGHPLL